MPDRDVIAALARGQRTRTHSAALDIPGTWATRGNCAIPPGTSHALAAAIFDVFDDPTTGITPAVRDQRLATVRRICASCPVLLECRQFGMTQTDGFYGGLTPEERTARRRGDSRSHEQLMHAVRLTERHQRTARATRAAHA